MKKRRAFTLAEVLITLAIIGIVAAITIPSIVTSYKDKQYNTARLNLFCAYIQLLKGLKSSVSTTFL